MNPSSRRFGGDGARYWIGVARWGLIILLAFELVVRTFVMRLPPYVYKPGWGVVPADNSWSVQGREGYGIQEYLENGEIKTPFEGGISIVVLGDSTVQAAQVNDEDNFVSLAEKALRARGIEADLHNLGKPERAIADYIYTAPAIRSYYAPRYVVIQVSLANFNLSFSESHVNHFMRAAEGELSLVHLDVEGGRLAYQNALFASGLFSFMDFRWQIVRDGFSFRTCIPRNNTTVGLDDASVIAAEITPQFFRHDILPQVKAIQQAYSGSEIIFLIVPYTPSLPPGEADAISWSSGVDNGLRLALSSIEGIRVVDAGVAFRKYYEKHRVLPRGSFNSAFNFGHLNQQGHQAVALVLAEFLEDLIQ